MGTLNFDGNDYIEQVLRKVKLGGMLPNQVTRYALNPGHLDMADQELFAWVEEVVSLWRRQADQGVPQTGDVSERLLAEHEKLRDVHHYRDAEWWRGEIRASLSAAADSRAAPEPDDPARDRPVPVAPSPSPSMDLPEADASDQAALIARSEGRDTPSSKPPSPLVRGATAEQQDDRVVVRWQAPLGVSRDATFTVERLARAGVEARQWTTSATTFEDREPPVGRSLVYRILTHHPDFGAPSAGTEVAALFTPPVIGLYIWQAADGRVTGRWQAPEGIRDTLVRRMSAGSLLDQDDSEPVPSQPDGFRDRLLPPGRYTYTVVPLYRDTATGTRVPGASRDEEIEVVEPPVPPRIFVSEDQQYGASTISLRWAPLPPGISLILRLAAAEPPGTPGNVLMLKDARDTGEMVEAKDGLKGTAGDVTLPAGRWVLVPFAVAGNLAVRGPSIRVTVIPPVYNAEATRNGADILVSWNWPEGLRLARIVWRTRDSELPREVTLSDFRRLGGVPLQSCEAVEALISGVVRSGADEMVSASVVVSVEAQKPTLTFHVHPVRPWQLRYNQPYRMHGPRWWCSRRRVVIMTDLPCAGVRLELYASTPAGGPDSEITIWARDDLNLEPGQPYEITLNLPDLSAMDPPRFMECRAETLSGPVRVNKSASTGREIRGCFR